MSDFRIFCELLAKMMLKAIDFTDVVEVYRRNEKPETLGIATCSYRVSLANQSRNEKPVTLGIATQKVLTLSPEGLGVEMKSPK